MFSSKNRAQTISPGWWFSFDDFSSFKGDLYHPVILESPSSVNYIEILWIRSLNSSITQSLQQGAPVKVSESGSICWKTGFMISCGRLCKYKHVKVVRLPAETLSLKLSSQGSDK